MKNLFNITLALLIAFFSLSCRDTDAIPEDIHEHEEIEKLLITVINKNNAADVQTVTYIGGVADGRFFFLPGEVYNVDLDFQVKHDDHYHSVNEEIIEEKDEHFITFEFAPEGISIQRSADDAVRTDGNKLGLKTEWTVNSVTAGGTVAIKLVHAATTVEQNYPTAANQQGRATGGETDVNAIIGLN